MSYSWALNSPGHAQIISKLFHIGPVDWSNSRSRYTISEHIIPSISPGSYICTIRLSNDVSNWEEYINLDVCSNIMKFPRIPIVEPYMDIELGIKTTLTFHFEGAPLFLDFSDLDGIDILSPMICTSLPACKKMQVHLRFNSWRKYVKPIIRVSNCMLYPFGHSKKGLNTC